MKPSRTAIITKIHLIISVVIVVPAAFIYGFKPELVLDINYKTIDEYNFSKAVMGLYLGFAMLWLFGVFKSSLLKAALISNTIFMLGLGFGRLTSIALDGVPTQAYLFGTIGELVLGCYGLWVLKTGNKRATDT